VKFVIRPAAREDILRQYHYYLIEADDELVAARFLKAVQSTIAQVCRQPGIGASKALRT
jgi:plasmid stabilization system protein ParE